MLFHDTLLTGAQVDAALASILDGDANFETLKVTTGAGLNYTLISDAQGNLTFVKNNFDAVVAPAVTNDTTEGYRVSSKWLNTVTKEAYVCLDATEDAAVWEQSTLDIADLGSMATQNSNSVDIDGGNIDGTTIGGTTPAAGNFTTVNSLTLTQAASKFTVTGGTGSAKTLTVDETKLLSEKADRVEVNQKAPTQAVVLDGTGSTGIQIADHADFDFGTGNLTVSRLVAFQDWSALNVLFSKNSDIDNGVYINTTADGKLNFGMIKTGEANFVYTTSSAPPLTDGNKYKITVVVSRETPLVAGSVSFYVDKDLFQTVTVPAGTPVNYNNTGILQLMGYLTTQYPGENSDFLLYNRALTAAQVVDLCVNGVSQYDKYGSQTPKQSDTMWTGASGATPPTNWTVTTNGTFTIFDSGDGAPYDACLKIEHDGVNNGPDIRRSFTAEIGKRYRVDVSFKHGTATSGAILVGSSTNGGEYVAWTSLTDATWIKRSIEFVATTTIISLRLYINTSTPGQYELFDEAIITKIGATAHYPSTTIQPIESGKWLDAANGHDATYPAVGASLKLKSDNYELVTGKAGGQTIIGGIGVADTLNLKGTIGNGTLTNPAINFLVGNNGATTAITVLNNGNVGIGTTSPSSLLHVSGGQVRSARTQNDSSSREHYVFDRGTGAGSYANFGTIGDGANGIAALTFGLGSSGQERMRIDSAGNVGIGTTAPQNKLDLLCSSEYLQFRLTETKTDATLNRVGIVAQHYTAAEEPLGLIFGRIDATTARVGIGGFTSSVNAATSIEFYTSANNTTINGTERMRIDSVGNVGIGTTDPTAYTSGNNGMALYKANYPTFGFGDAGAKTWLMYKNGDLFHFYQGGVSGVGNTMTFLDKNVGLAGITAPTAKMHIAAGTASAGTAPIKLTTGTLNTSPEVGAIEYNNTFHVVNSDAGRRHIVTAPNNTKETTGAPLTNDGFVWINIGGTDFKVMTTA